MWEAKKNGPPPFGGLQNKKIASLLLGGGAKSKIPPPMGGGKYFFAAFGRISPFCPPHSQKRGGATDVLSVRPFTCPSVRLSLSVTLDEWIFLISQRERSILIGREPTNQDA